MIKDLEMERLSWWAPCNHKGLYKWEVKGSKSEKGSVTWEAEIRVMYLKMYEGHEEKNMGGP